MTPRPGTGHRPPPRSVLAVLALALTAASLDLALLLARTRATDECASDAPGPAVHLTLGLGGVVAGGLAVVLAILVLSPSRNENRSGDVALTVLAAAIGTLALLGGLVLALMGAAGPACD